MELKKENQFESLNQSIGKFHLRNKIVLIPEMNRISAHLLAAVFRGFNIHAKVLETYQGLDLGKEHTSGKECYPCQVTMGDILYFLKKEKERLGELFDSKNYIYFLPESDGPCRFGMYNKYQRMVLDSFPYLRGVKIASLTTRDGYSLNGLIEPGKVPDFRKASYYAVVTADILDRLLWRVRPYEKEGGIADEFIDRSRCELASLLEKYGPLKMFEKIMDKLEEVIEEGKNLINSAIPPKPLVGIVGEIFLRMHSDSNQNLIRMLEKHGAEVVNASLAEWINFISYESLKNSKHRLHLYLKQFRFSAAKNDLIAMIKFGTDLFYQEFRQRRIYNRVLKIIDLIDDHRVAHLDKTLKKDDTFSFQLGTEACLSIATIIDSLQTGYNGMVNVYPFTCMPSMTTSAVVRPLIKKARMPYLDVSYDSSVQPGRETTVRTFMHQACQHFERNGNKRLTSR